MNTGLRRVLPFKWLFWERLLNKLIKLTFLSYGLAWLLTCTSVQTYVNVPIAVLVVLTFYWLSTRLILSDSGRDLQNPQTRRHRKFHKSIRSDYYYREKVRDPPDRDAWKKSVNAPIVESAWESFCGSIIQEWIYDSWYCMMSPDREFPAEIRRMLNEAFAELTQRAKKIDLRTLLLRDMCDLFTEQLELYRATKAGVGILNEGDLSLSKKDRAFQQEMKTDQTLHVAFYSRDGHYRMIRRMAEGVVGLILSKEDVERPVLRSLGRELLATCVIRNVVMLFTPYNANKILLSLLEPKKVARHRTKGSTSDSEHSCTRASHVNGQFQFEQRVRTSVFMEELATKKGFRKQKRCDEQRRSLSISQSNPNLETADVQREGEDSTETLEDMRVGSSSSISENFKNAIEDPPFSFKPHNTEETVGTSVAKQETSLPLIPASSMGSRSDGVDELERMMNLIDSQVPIEDMAFVGHPRARVVAPEMSNNGGREYVVFNIRVADKTGEWTVTRRYRNFEALHKCLRDLPEYRELRPRLPPKTFLIQTHKTEVVEQRRIALDRYLQTILSNDVLASNRDIWLFLSNQSYRSFTPDIKVGLVKKIANNVDTARHRIKRNVASTLAESPTKAELKKENALRLLDGSECSSVAGSVRIDDESELSTPMNRTRPQNNERLSTGLMDSPVRHNASVPDGLENMVINDGRRCSQGRRNTQKQVVFAPPEKADQGFEHALPGDLKNSSLLSRFECQDRDAIGRQVEKNAASSSISAAGGARSLKRTNSWRKFMSRDASGSEEDEDSDESEFDDYSGISGPLYEVADAIFNFPAQKFFRRQMFQVVRQALSFLAGDAIDVYLNEKIKTLRSERTLAWMIHHLKSTLWPGGVWFAAAKTTQPSAPSGTSSTGRNKGLQSDTYLEAAAVEVDAQEVAKNLESRLFDHAPDALVRLIGHGNYMRAMKDVYDMFQLPTFVRQIGYGVLEIGLLALFPELKDLFAKIHREARFRPESRR